MAGRYNIVIEKAATFGLELTWKDSAGSVINVQDATISMDIRKSSDQTLMINLGTANGKITITPENKIVLALTAAETAALSAEPAKYDLMITQGAEVTRLIEGFVSISPAVTQ